MNSATIRTMLAATSFAVLTACGGGSTDNGASVNQSNLLLASTVSSADSTPAVTATSADSTPAATATAARVLQGGTLPDAWTGASALVTPNDAARFLGQASFGPTISTIDDVVKGGKETWLTNQFAKPLISYRAYMDSVSATGTAVSQNQFHEMFWKEVTVGGDQLRQRTAYALSQIFVISFQDATIAEHPRGVAAYYDVLNKNAFGNFRDLLQAVATHPMMGIYMSHLRNEKESGARLPDENFARELLQLMSIGLYQLNNDGSVKLSNGNPIETYTHDDIAGLAKVFTGWSFGGPDKATNRFYGSLRDADWEIKPMQNFPAFHSTSAKNFLNVSISGATTGEADLKVALDTIFNHANVGPFIGRQLIQHLVTSNPSPAYINRVASAFNDNGSGVRGDMKAVIKAILLDPEAIAAPANAQGKLREPVLRLANWMRAFNVKSTSGKYLMGNLDDPLSALNQSPLRSASVFNFYRPGYTPPNTDIAAAGLVSPEMQIEAEPSAAGYLNYIHDVIYLGAGTNRDMQPDYSAEFILSATPADLVDRVNLLLMNGAMSSTLRAQIMGAMNSINQPTPTSSNADVVKLSKNYRIYMSIFLTMASPEYLVQK